MHVLLVEPPYYTRYPPLGLLKLATYHKMRGDSVELIRGLAPARHSPDSIYVTSLFTYAWKSVHQAIQFYQGLYRRTPIILGGIYATIMPEHAELSGAEVRPGLNMDVECLIPDYSLVPQFRANILISSRGCIRRCSFCAAPVLEPFDPRVTSLKSISHVLYPDYRKVIFWDNNFLANPHWRNIVSELKMANLTVDFNQGIDARLINEEIADELRGLRLEPIRLAYDTRGQRGPVRRAISLLEKVGFSKRQMIVYMIYNFEEHPEEFLDRLRDVLEWGAVAYPMRYEPINVRDAQGNPLSKNSFISQRWSADYLEMLARARRVLGYGGAFPPYDGLMKKLINATSFEQAFSLRPVRKKQRMSVNSQLAIF